jgi:hypothetical protein
MEIPGRFTFWCPRISQKIKEKANYLRTQKEAKLEKIYVNIFSLFMSKILEIFCSPNNIPINEIGKSIQKLWPKIYGKCFPRSTSIVKEKEGKICILLIKN